MCFGADDVLKSFTTRSPATRTADRSPAETKTAGPQYCQLHLEGLEGIFDIADQNGFCAADRDLAAKSYRLREIAKGGRGMFEVIMPTLAKVNEDIHVRGMSSSADGQFVVYLETADPSGMADALAAVDFNTGELLVAIEKGEGRATVSMTAELDAVIAGTEGVNTFRMTVHIYDPEQVEVVPFALKAKVRSVRSVESMEAMA